MPGRGTLTAWADVLTRAIKSADIYEYDLTQCFERLKIKKTIDMIREIGIPTHLGHELESLNESAVRLPKIRKLDESIAEAKKEHVDRLSYLRKEIGDEGISALRSLSNLSENYQKLPAPVLSKLLENDVIWKYIFGGNVEDHTVKPEDRVLVTIQGLMRGSQPTAEEIKKEDLQTGGFPQGAATSPILSAFNINYTVLGLLDHVMYADDGILFNIPNLDEPSVLDNEEHGTKINISKSGWVKKNGRWQKELKFLGLVYNGQTKELRSETRKGRSLKMNRWDA